MTKLTFDQTTEHYEDYSLEIEDRDRIKIVVNGEYVTYLQCVAGQLTYLSTKQIKAI